MPFNGYAVQPGTSSARQVSFRLEGNLDEGGTSNPSNIPTKARSSPYLSLMAGLGPYIHWEEGKAKWKTPNLIEPQ